MAKLIPAIDVDEIANSGERHVAGKLLSQLPNSVVIYHSINLLVKQKSGFFRDGECDFTIVDPQNGILFLEAKGGRIHYDNTSGIWQRDVGRSQDFQKIKDPFDQVNTNMHELIGIIKDKLDLQYLPFTFTCAVAFPNYSFTGEPPPGMKRNQIWDYNTFKNLVVAISNAFKVYGRGNKGNKKISQDMMNSIHHALRGHFGIFPVLCREIEKQEAQLYRCTEDQKKVFHTLQNWNKLAVEGGAGTGKTLLALWKAQQLALSGKRTLLLCYNKALAEWLTDLSSENLTDSLTICNYHKLAHRFCDMVGEDFNPKAYENENEFWKSTAPEKLTAAADQISDDHKFDAVVVDEGQDFYDLWWMSLEYIFRRRSNDRFFYVFFDPNQNLYVRTNWNLPDEIRSPPITLRENCRNSAQIAEHCANLVGTSYKSSIQPMINQEALKICKVKNIKQAFSRTGKIVRKLCVSAKGPLSYSQIVVLAPKSSKIAGNIYRQWPTEFKSVPITQDPNDWRNNQGVLIITAHSFKGLEADAVIMISKPLPENKSNDHVVNYVGRSRAKHILRVIEVENI